MTDKVSIYARIPAATHARMQDILERLRKLFGGASLSMNDVVGTGIDLLGQWLDLYEAGHVEFLGGTQPTPQEPVDAPRPKSGRRRKAADADEGAGEGEPC